MDEFIPTLNLLNKHLPNIFFDNVTILNEKIKLDTHDTLNGLLNNFVIINESKLDLLKGEKYYIVFNTLFYSFANLLLFLKSKSKNSNKIFSLLQNFDVNLIIFNNHEILNKNEINEFEKIFKNNKIDLEKVFLFSNNVNLQNKKIKHFKSEELINIINTFPEIKFNDFLNKKGKFFLCKNKEPKVHRNINLILLKKNNLLDKTNYSFLVSKNFDYEEYLDTNNYKYEIESLNDKSVKTTDFEKKMNYTKFGFSNDFPDNFASTIQIDDYKNSYVNIVTESLFFSEIIHISEKSFKPFYFFQIPIFLSSPFHVKNLENIYNLDLFRDIINHDYDEEENHMKRMFMISEEIKRVSTIKDKIINFYNNNKKRFEENQKIIIDYRNKRMNQQNLIGLIKK